MKELMRMLGLTAREQRYLAEVPESAAVQRLRRALAIAGIELDNLSRKGLAAAVEDLRDELLDEEHCV